MLKKILLLLASILFLVIINVAFYPNPIELIAFFIIGLSILTLFVLLGINLDKLTLSYPIKLRRYAKGVFYVIASFCFLFFITVLNISWFKKEIILNIFKDEIGQGFLIITVSYVTVILIYCVIFHFRKKRVPSSDELENELSFKGKSGIFTQVTLKNIFLYIIVVVFATIFWVVLFLTIGQRWKSW